MRDPFKQCPDHAALARAFFGEAGGAEQEALARHVLRCPRCRLKLDVLRQLHRELGPVLEKLPEDAEIESALDMFQEAAKSRHKNISVRKAKPAGPRFLGVPLLAFAGALAVFLIAIGAVTLSRGRFAFSPLRKASVMDIRMIEPVGSTRGRPEIFRWAKVAGADSYEFVLIDENLNTIHTAKASYVPELVIPLAVGNQLERGKVYVWEVKARDDNDALLRSGKGSFTIR